MKCQRLESLYSMFLNLVALIIIYIGLLETRSALQARVQTMLLHPVTQKMTIFLVQSPFFILSIYIVLPLLVVFQKKLIHLILESI